MNTIIIPDRFIKYAVDEKGQNSWTGKCVRRGLLG